MFLMLELLPMSIRPSMAPAILPSHPKRPKVTAAFLTFGRFGWLGKIAGAMLGLMLIGNNSNIKNIVSGDGGQGRNVNEAETTTRSGGMKR